MNQSALSDFVLFLENPKDEKKDSFQEKLLTQVIKNLQVKITNIHIRYEDDVSIPQKSHMMMCLCYCIHSCWTGKLASILLHIYFVLTLMLFEGPVGPDDGHRSEVT